METQTCLACKKPFTWTRALHAGRPRDYCDRESCRVTRDVARRTIPKRQCQHCALWYQPIVRSGRPTEYCFRVVCRKAMKLAWGMRYRERIKAGYVPKEFAPRVKVVPPPAPTPKPSPWWVAQAEAIRETCERCEGPVEGVYIPPTRETANECAVVAHCRLCGRERMVLSGMAGTPYEDQTREPLKGPKRRAGMARRAPVGA